MVRFAHYIAPTLLFAALAAGAFFIAAPVASAETLQLEITALADEDVWFESAGDEFWDSDLEVLSGVLAQGDDEGNFFLVALRFLNVTIPQGATIGSATLTIGTAGSAGGDGNFGLLYGHDTDDASAWGGATTPVNMTKTTASAALLGSDLIADEFDSHVIDVTDIVQEIVDRSGWASGNDLAFGGDDTGAGDAISYYSFELNQQASSLPVPTLDIEYTEGGGEEEPWYNDSWPYRVEVTVDNTKVDADLTDFPVYVDLSDLPADFHTNVKSDGGDIRVTTSDGTTEVPREVVFYDADTDTGELHFKGTLANSSDTIFYIYYGNSGASDHATDATYGAENVWNDAYKGVYHLPDGSTLDVSDSTATQDGTNSSATASTGKLDGSVNVVSSQYIDLGQTGAHYNPITVSAWIKPSSTGSTQQQIISKGFDGTNTQWQLVTDTGSAVSFNSFTNPNVNGATSAGTVSNGTWYHAVGVYDGTTWRVYLNGSPDGSSVDTAPTNTNQKIAIGGVFSSGSIVQNWRGDIDEARISNVARSAEWIATEYDNQNDSDTFYALGSQEENDGGGGEEEAPARVIRLQGNVRLQGVRLF